MSGEDGVTVDLEREVLNPREVRRVYLITYSRANTDIVPSRNSFSRIVLKAFRNTRPESSCSIIQWVCSKEPHNDEGLHYQMAVKLNTATTSA